MYVCKACSILYNTGPTLTDNIAPTQQRISKSIPAMGRLFFRGMEDSAYISSTQIILKVVYIFFLHVSQSIKCVTKNMPRHVGVRCWCWCQVCRY